MSAIIGGALVFLFGFGLGLVPIRGDNDCWWHVKTGKIIAEEGLPKEQVFSFGAEGYEWHNHEWLTELAMWHIWNTGENGTLGGWRAVTMAKSIAIGAAGVVLFVLAGRISRNWWIGLLAAALGVAAARHSYYPRPPLVTNVLIALELLLIAGVHEKWWRRGWLWMLPPMFALWSNLHGGWLAGLVILGAYGCGDLLEKIPMPERARRLYHAAPSPVPMGWWLLLGPACALATLANPSGWHLWKLPVRVMGDTELTAMIAELMPPEWKFLGDFLVAWCAMGLLAGVLLAMRRLPFRPAEWMIFAFFLWQGIHHVRHLLLFGIVCVPLTARVLAAAFERRNEGQGTRDEGGGLRFAAALVMALVVMGAAYRNWPQGASYWARNKYYVQEREGYEPYAFPRDQCDFVQAAVLEGRMFNRDAYAGYLIWRFSPEEYQTFCDPRFDIFGGDVWRQERIIGEGGEPPPGSDAMGWKELLDHWKINWLLIQGDTGLSWRLSQPEQAGWTLVGDWPPPGPYNPRWQIWVRNSDANRTMIARALETFEKWYHRTPDRREAWKKVFESQERKQKAGGS